MSKFRLIKEFFEYMASNKKLWLVPMVIILLLIGMVILISQSSAIAPFIYSLF